MKRKPKPATKAAWPFVELGRAVQAWDMTRRPELYGGTAWRPSAESAPALHLAPWPSRPSTAIKCAAARVHCERRFRQAAKLQPKQALPEGFFSESSGQTTTGITHRRPAGTQKIAAGW